MYESLPYIEAYTAHTDARVEADPHAAIGGRWEEVGRLQFDYLASNGLRPDHRMLDIGCGTLRGGRHFIRYLGPERYTGFERDRGRKERRSMKKRSFEVSLYLNVFDESALFRAAREWAVSDNAGEEIEKLVSEDVHEALRMLLDPGESPPGCEILDSAIEEGPSGQ